MQEIRSKAETCYDFGGEDMRQAEVSFEQGGSRWRRAAGGILTATDLAVLRYNAGWRVGFFVSDPAHPARLRHRAQARVQLGERGRSGGGVHTVRERRTEMRKCAYLAVAALGAVAFLAAHDWATAWRGYEAVGGEFLLLLAPLWARMAARVAEDWRSGW